VPAHRVPGYGDLASVYAPRELHTYFLDRLVPVCQQLLDTAVGAGEVRPGTQAYELMRGIGNLCIGRVGDPRYDPRRLVDLFLRGLHES
jgi:hypothetical protein